MRHKFSRNVQPKPCLTCGKLTTFRTDDTAGVCTSCYDLQGLVNAHLDGEHKTVLIGGCPECEDKKGGN
jgi:phage/plasmid primase-like uncharacterized protein